MGKPHDLPAVDLIDVPPRRRTWLILALGLLASPFVYEGTLLCVAQWRELFGMTPNVSTPVLSAVRGWASEVYRALCVSGGRFFNNVPWKPSIVVPIACAWAFIAGLFLRKR